MVGAFIAAVVILSASGVWAQQYNCTFSERSNRGPVPEQLSVSLNIDGYEAKVQDSFTRQVSSVPVSAELEMIGPEKARVSWRLTGISYRGSQTHISSGVVDYQLNFRFNTNRATLTGVSREFYSHVHGQGTCVRSR
jgi:hypothetical protein